MPSGTVRQLCHFAWDRHIVAPTTSMSHLKNVCESAPGCFLDHHRLAVAALGRGRQWRWRFRSALRRLLPRGLHNGYGHEGVRSQQRHDAACTAAQSIRMYLRVLANYAARTSCRSISCATETHLLLQTPPQPPHQTPCWRLYAAAQLLVVKCAPLLSGVQRLVDCPAGLLASALPCDLQHPV